MDLALAGKLLLILLLIMGNAFFVASEISLTSARRSRIKQLADTGNKSAKIVQLLHNEPERFYSVTQIGITLVSLALGAIGMVTVSQILDPPFEALYGMFSEGKGLIKIAHTTSYAVAFMLISFLHVVGGELAPKVLAFNRAETLSLAVARIINFFYRALAWLIWIMNKAARGLLWLFGQGDLAVTEGRFSISEEEIRTILSASEREGILNPEETKMIRGVFDLDEHTVREAMIPRTEILAFAEDDTVEQILEVFKDSRHARFPIFKDSLDNIVGILAMKELLGILAEQESDAQAMQQPLRDLMHEPYFVPESKKLSKLLREFKENRNQMAVVLDEFGGTAGIITLEDILEEIVGEYYDEYTPLQRYVKKDKGSQFIIDASIHLADLEGMVNFPFPEGDYITLGGFIFHELGSVPKVGDKIDLDGAQLEVLEMDNKRIAKVLFQDLTVAEDGSVELAEKPAADQPSANE